MLYNNFTPIVVRQKCVRRSLYVSLTYIQTKTFKNHRYHSSESSEHTFFNCIVMFSNVLIIIHNLRK